MSYIRYVPSPPLDQYIHHLYYLDGAMPFPRERILPSPTLDLKVNLGGSFRLNEEGQTRCPKPLTESWLTGLSSVYHTIDWPPDMRLYGVRFMPDGAYPFLGLPISELYNQVVSLDALWGRFASEIREQLEAAPTIQAGLALFERLLLARLCEKPHEQRIVDHCIAEIARHHGALSIRALSDQVGISQNHLATQFKRVVGTSAKVVARLYRFEHVLRSIDSPQPVNWTQLALQCGYYDQPHFNREFLALTGHSPSTYQHLRRRVYRENALVDQLSLRILPVD
jgi:AraC-like DNA-binding protein